MATADKLEHCCGKQGFNQMLGDECPACSAPAKTVPANVVYCRGTKCHTMASCEFLGQCGYKSSSDLFREAKDAEQLEAFPSTESAAADLFRTTYAGPVMSLEPEPVVRTFTTGANRDVDNSKLDYEGFLAPRVLKRFAEYMHKNRFLRDGSMRDSDNWQKGMPRNVFLKSLFRHFFSVWSNFRTNATVDKLPELESKTEEDLCAVMFNSMGLLNELLLKRDV